jgi:phage shock protein PspC (stress-responsive transcriptional regulator)
VATLATLTRAVSGAIRGREWSRADRIVNLLFIAALDCQVLLGLLLYLVLSPIVPRSSAEFKASMHVSTLRFFAVEHITLMVLALIAAHVTLVFSRKAATDRTRHRRLAWGVGLTLLLIFMAIPWPWTLAARPLLRGF